MFVPRVVFTYKSLYFVTDSFSDCFCNSACGVMYFNLFENGIFWTTSGHAGAQQVLTCFVSSVTIVNLLINIVKCVALSWHVNIVFYFLSCPCSQFAEGGQDFPAVPNISWSQVTGMIQPIEVFLQAGLESFTSKFYEEVCLANMLHWLLNDLEVK